MNTEQNLDYATEKIMTIANQTLLWSADLLRDKQPLVAKQYDHACLMLLPDNKNPFIQFMRRNKEKSLAQLSKAQAENNKHDMLILTTILHFIEAWEDETGINI